MCQKSPEVCLKEHPEVCVRKPLRYMVCVKRALQYVSKEPYNMCQKSPKICVP